MVFCGDVSSSKELLLRQGQVRVYWKKKRMKKIENLMELKVFSMVGDKIGFPI